MRYLAPHGAPHRFIIQKIMLTIHTKRYIKCATLEKAHAWVVVAFVCEEREGAITLIGKPRIIKIIPKKTHFLLAGASSVRSQPFLLIGGFSVPRISCAHVSAFFTSFKTSDQKILIGVAPQPPTFQLSYLL